MDDIKKVLGPLLPSDTDVIFYLGPLVAPYDDDFIKGVVREKRNDKLLLYLRTYGGSPDATYRMIRTLQKLYGSYELAIDGMCKSAGTLFAIGANKLYMTSKGELGPIDIQLPKHDELRQHSSTITLPKAFIAIRQQAIHMLIDTANGLVDKFGISVKCSLETASELSKTILHTFCNQIDPMLVGEYHRAMDITVDYGNRVRTSNVKDNTIAFLITNYPSHSFVIDDDEARVLFEEVEHLDDNNMLTNLFDQMTENTGYDTAKPEVFYLSQILNLTNMIPGGIIPSGSGETDNAPEQPNGCSHEGEQGNEPGDASGRHESDSRLHPGSPPQESGSDG